jgi:hypothetical protein
MAELGAIVGETGSGKTTSLRNLDPKSTFIINVANKALPFKGFKKYYTPFKKEDGQPTGNLYNTNDVEQITKILKIIDRLMPHIKVVVIDDSQYLMAKKD